MRQQSKSRQATGDVAVRRRFLQDARAAAAQFRPHRADHFEARRNVFQCLGNVLAQHPQSAAAIGAGLLHRREGVGFARQFGGQLTPRGFARRLPLCLDLLYPRRLGRGLAGFGMFQLQCELGDVARQLLRARPELHALQLQDEQLQVLDFGLARIEFGLFGEHEGFERCQSRSGSGWACAPVVSAPCIT